MISNEFCCGGAAGDFVDRGAWGVEVLALLMAYKWLLPHNVYLVRGNHESNIITQVYGELPTSSCAEPAAVLQDPAAALVSQGSYAGECSRTVGR